MRTPHSSTRKGRQVKITTRDGDIFVGKFKEKKGSTIILEENTVSEYAPEKLKEEYKCAWRQLLKVDRTKFIMKDVRAFSIYKPTCQL